MVDLRVSFPKDEASLSEVLQRTLALLAWMQKRMEAQEERISALTEVVYELAPEYEIIETMADSEEERRDLLARYMNHNDSYCQEAE